MAATSASTNASDGIASTSNMDGSSQHPFVTQKLVDTGRYFCPFLERGFCRESSSRCNFSHDSRNSTKIPTDFCHFYLANKCLYGQDCKFIHDEPLAHILDDGVLNIANINLIESNSNYDNNNCVCTYSHGQICDLCYMPCLHPYDEAQRRQHRDDCLREHEREMELSFAVQRSKDKICGICMETVVEKKPVTSSRFGILEKCNHIFCLDCIRKWRGTKQFDSKTIRACPECRVNSDFVVPSKFWIEDQDDKEKLIRDYKAALRSKPCRYFKEGMGECPFAGSCFYKHAYPDGRLAEMEAPKPRRRVYGSRGAASLTNYVLWSLIRSFEDEDWSNEDESESRYYIDDDEDDEDIDDDDVEHDDDEDDDDDEANVADYTAPVW